MSTTILSPLLHAVTPVDSSGNIVVQVDNPDNDICFASVFDYNPGAGTGLGASHGSVRMRAVPPGGRVFQAVVNVGHVTTSLGPPADNKFLQVENQNEGTLDGNSFTAVPSGSGSDKLLQVAFSVHRCAHCSDGQPVPVALRLRLDSKVAAGTCADCSRLNQPTVLVHSNDAKFVCCWLSQPINFCADGTNPGWWMLEKTDASTWTLTLRHSKAVIATYALTTNTPKDCSFPIKLKIVGKGGKECKRWPKTVTVAPGP